MTDRPHTAKVIDDILRRMDSESLEWYRENVGRLARMMNSDYGKTHALILQMRNQ